MRRSLSSLLTTPSRVTADIRKLCRRIGGLEEPLFVDVTPRPDSEVDDCFQCVQRQVSEQGGWLQHGWMLWEWPGISAEGTFHAVWRRPDGSLLDVNRKQDDEPRILFAPDKQRIFEGQRVDTVRVAIGRNPKIKEWIDLNNRFDRIISRRIRNVPFGTEFVVEGEALELRRRAVALSIELYYSREARRAADDVNG